MARVEFDQELERLETEIKIMASTVESSIEKSIITSRSGFQSNS